MLDMLFMFCAAVGGAILVIQFGLMLLGLGDELGGDVDADFDAGGDLDVDADVGLDGEHQTAFTEAADADFDHPATMWVFQVISVRGIVAAVAFFGLGGLWARASEMNPGAAIGVGALLGFASMYAVYWMMKQLYKLRSSGTVDISNARGCDATIYVPVPASGEGRGKIHMTLQGRTMEYQAVTDDAEGLPTGENVVITEVLGNDLVRVARVEQHEAANA